MSELPTPSIPETQPQAGAQSVPTPALAPETQMQLPTPHHGKRIIFIAGAAVVGMGAVAGLAYASWAGYLPNPFSQRPSAENFIASLEALQSAQISTTVHLALEPQDDNVEPLDFSLFENSSETGSSTILGPLMLAQILPSDLDLNLTVNSSFTKADTGASQETHITGTYTANNITANLDLTTRSVNDTTYIKPDAIPLPIPIFDMSALEGKWIDLNKNNDREVFTANLEDEMGVDEKDEKSDVRNEAFVILKQAITDGSIVFSVPERVTANGQRVWKTEAVIDGEKLRETIISVGKNRDTLFPGVTHFALLDNEFLVITRKERAKDMYRELFARTNVSALLNDDSSPVSLSFSTHIAPKLADNTFKNQQITLETTIGFTHLNEEITVEAPEGAINTTKAGALLLGKSEESVLADAQRSTITDLQTALETYVKENKTYPEALNDLIGTHTMLRKVTAVPPDIMTEKPYIYTKTEAGYTLVYQMPEAEDDLLSHFGKSTTVVGTNTATEKLFSEEGAKITDSDKDGLSEYDEVMIYGTRDQMNDTDSDGYDDKTEIEGGYNPNGDGTLVTR